MPDICKFNDIVPDTHYYKAGYVLALYICDFLRKNNDINKYIHVTIARRNLPIDLWLIIKVLNETLSIMNVVSLAN